ncbi:MAG: hypothetical protein ABFE13_04400 [Phycisphaerales bacterium]
MFYNEPWFWTGIFGLAGSTITILATGTIQGRTQIRLERVRANETQVLQAYQAIYTFIALAERLLYPPDDNRRDFISIMKSYLEKVKPHLLFYPKEIRAILQTLEAQYQCLGDPDLIPEEPFEEFMDKRIHKLFLKLSELVEKRTEAILHKT